MLSKRTDTDGLGVFPGLALLAAQGTICKADPQGQTQARILTVPRDSVYASASVDAKPIHKMSSMRLCWQMHPPWNGTMPSDVVSG